ncbi:hypothetical protein [Streptomyces antarcticus]|uniref:hypothetical protein n=1 Tax=Streptomyces antarcticus TaxID=2996458 RepID=UPI002270D645|nr:hypothetical protein [Streptomyces sp. H34-AA3]MCY0946296.1 hypothetical protein [Streptomyces sp. H34-AA3]
MTMPQFMYAVDVPIERTDTGERGVHVFTGLAEDGGEARKAAQRAWETALLYTMAGQDIPTGASNTDWSARGLRAGWDLLWHQATDNYIPR